MVATSNGQHTGSCRSSLVQAASGEKGGEACRARAASTTATQRDNGAIRTLANLGCTRNTQHAHATRTRDTHTHATRTCTCTCTCTHAWPSPTTYNVISPTRDGSGPGRKPMMSIRGFGGGTPGTCPRPRIMHTRSRIVDAPMNHAKAWMACCGLNGLRMAWLRVHGTQNGHPPLPTLAEAEQTPLRRPQAPAHSRIRGQSLHTRAVCLAPERTIAANFGNSSI